MAPIFQRFQRDIKAIAWLAIGSFLSLSLYSYSPLDPSFNSVGHQGKVLNFCGYFGSFLSDFLYQALGLAAWVLVLACVRLAIRNFQGRATSFVKIRLIWAILLLMTSSALFSLYFSEVTIFSQKIPVGGALGLLISKSLIKIFNPAGVGVILWSLALVLTVFYTEKPLSAFIKAPTNSFKYLSRLAIDRLILAAIRGIQAFYLSLIQKYKTWSSFRKLRPRKVESISKLEDKTFSNIAVERAVEKPIDAVKIEAPKPVQFQLFSKKRRVKMQAKVARHIENWELPDINLLEDPPDERVRMSEKELRDKADLLVEKLKQFSVHGTIVDIKPGPAVTMFEFKPNADVKISRIIDLADDISLALSSESVRIIAPIPGRNVVGIETSNSVRETVYVKDIVASREFWTSKIELPIILGRQASGETKIVELRKMPHLLVAGTTGSGKSVFLVSALTGLLCRHSPKTLRMILIDPKQVDLAAFCNIPHLLMPPVLTPKKAVLALRWAINEMEKRYRTMSKFGARNLEGLNQKLEKFTEAEVQGHEEQNQKLQEDPSTTTESYYYTPRPLIVIVVEEFGDLMAVDKNNVEHAVIRLAQMARACGIHLILAMQSPRKDVITGLIKTNIPGRISFKVASKMDSRIILDESGAERLLAQGDMLYLAPGVAKPERHHGAWMTEEDVDAVMNFWTSQGEPDYDPLAMKVLESCNGEFEVSLGGFDDGSATEPEFDERYDEILSYVSAMKEVSASLLQRKFRLGYPRAARIIEVFEEQGVVGPANGSKPRQVLVDALS